MAVLQHEIDKLQLLEAAGGYAPFRHRIFERLCAAADECRYARARLARMEEKERAARL